MRRFRSALVMGLLSLGTAMTPAVRAADASPQPAIRLVDARHIELPDVRILSMSPEGSSIAGVRPAIGYSRGELCTFDVATLGVRACTSIAELGSSLRLGDVTWSPDGSMLAFTANAFQTFKDADLWVMDGTTGHVTNLDDDGFEGTMPLGGDETSGLITVDVSPAFTPDGRTVSFSRSMFQGGEREGNDIATVPVEGGTPTPLIAVSDRLGVAYYGMAWSSDGTVLYYSLADPDPDDPRNGIWVVAADGTDAQLIASTTDPELGAPALARVSPAGDQLLAWHPIGAMRRDGQDVLTLVDTATGSQTPLTLEDPATRIESIQMATFSPDGSALLEVTAWTEPDHQVRVRDLETGAITPLIPDGLEAAGPPEYGLMPTWATNGTALITGGGDLSGATLLTIEGGLPPPQG